MNLLDFLKRKEALLAIDIGSNSVKMMEVDLAGEPPRLVNIAVTPVPEDIFSNNLLSKADAAAERISQLLEQNGITDRRVAVAMPEPTVFTKKIRMAKVPPVELAGNVQLEAGSFIPHNIDAVRIDFHVLGEAGKNQLDVLVVAVKNEIIDSFVKCLSLAGLEAAVVDVDYFALQNCFELGYPELKGNTVALINMGARYASINVCRHGQSLFTGDIAVGGRTFTEAIAQDRGTPLKDAEQLKLRAGKEAGSDIAGVLDRKLEYVAAEFNRQLSLFWNASGADEGIDRIMLAGGGALVPGLLAELSQKTGIQCELLNPLKGIECGEGFDAAYLQELAPFMAVCTGLALRQPGDKELSY